MVRLLLIKFRISTKFGTYSSAVSQQLGQTFKNEANWYCKIIQDKIIQWCKWSRKQVSDKQDEDLNTNLTKIDQDVTITVEPQNEYASVNPEQEGVIITVETKTEYPSVNIEQ